MYLGLLAGVTQVGDAIGGPASPSFKVPAALGWPSWAQVADCGQDDHVSGRRGWSLMSVLSLRTL